MKLNLLLAFLFAIFINKQSIALNKQLADSLFSIGKYSFAAYEYEKEIFNNADETIINKLLLKKAYCYKNLHDFNACYINLNRIRTTPENQDLYFVYTYEKALCLYMLENYSGCYTELNLIEQNVTDSTFKNSCLLLKVLTLCELEKFEEGKVFFKELIKINNIESKADSTVYKFENLKLKSERKAKTLSIIFPGLGQFYAKKPLQGISAILIEGITVSYCVVSIVTGYYFTAFLTGASLSTRFYIGGQNNSISLVKKYNINKKKELIYSINKFALQNLII